MMHHWGRLNENQGTNKPCNNVLYHIMISDYDDSREDSLLDYLV